MGNENSQSGGAKDAPTKIRKTRRGSTRLLLSVGEVPTDLTVIGTGSKPAALKAAAALAGKYLVVTVVDAFEVSTVTETITHRKRFDLAPLKS